MEKRLLIMKNTLLAFLFFATTATAQDSTAQYAESPVTVTVTQFFASILLNSFEPTYEKADLIDAVKPFAGSGTKPDSTFTVSVKAKHLWTAINYIMTAPSVSGYENFAKYILNQKIGGTGAAITGYTALRTQIINKANSATAERFAAQWIVQQYTERENALNALLLEDRGRNRKREKEKLN